MRRTAHILVGWLVFVLAWQGICVFFELPEWLFPKPAQVASTFVQTPMYFLRSTGTTLGASIIGFLMAATFAASLSVMFFLIPVAERFLMPGITGFKAVPLVAIAPLLVLWCGTGMFSRSLMAATICFFPLVIGFQRGFRSCSDDEMLFLRSLELSRPTELFRYRLLRGAPFWLAGAKLSAVTAPVGAIVAEYSTANSGLGYIILDASIRNNAKRLVVAVILSALVGMTLFIIAAGIERIILRRLNLQAVDEI